MARTMNYFYIIKVECGKVHKTWYKIGEESSEKRIKNLLDKYNQYRSNNAEHIATWNIPHDAEHRLTDKAIHKYLKAKHKNEVKPVDQVHAEHYLGTSDGVTEFFEVIQPDFDIVDCVNTFITTCDASLYTGIFEETKLSYEKDKYHLVDNMLIEKILTKFPIVDRILYKESNNNVLLIGQFEHDFVASFAMCHNVVILHDDKDNIHQFKTARLNNAIKYIETVEDLYTMNIKFDLIIANPPYGKPGANITKNIIDNVYFEEYVNLLPANDYKRNDSKDLFRYAREMESINDGFNDAVVTTHLCEIAKEANNITLDEFEISNYTDNSLKKYFYENLNRPSIYVGYDSGNHPSDWDSNIDFIIGVRDWSHGHMPYTKDCAQYKFNVEHSITGKELEESRNNTYYKSLGKVRVHFNAVRFKSPAEHNNFVKFIYSRDGFRFASKIFTALNTDGNTNFDVLPKVDWTHSWTVEEILKDYGYTDLEIENIMEDLDNFKGMDD